LSAHHITRRLEISYSASPQSRSRVTGYSTSPSGDHVFQLVSSPSASSPSFTADSAFSGSSVFVYDGVTTASGAILVPLAIAVYPNASHSLIPTPLLSLPLRVITI